MTDYRKLQDIFEMAEVLSTDSADALYVEAYDPKSDKIVVIKFKFNEDKELTEVVIGEE